MTVVGSGTVILTGRSAEILRSAVVVIEKMRSARFDLARTRRKFRFIGTIAQLSFREVLEIEASQMAAVMMDVVLALLLSIGQDIDACLT